MEGYCVQFIENHKWCGCFGLIVEEKNYQDGKKRYMIGVPEPMKGVAYIFDDGSGFEVIGAAPLIFANGEKVSTDQDV